MSPALTRLGSVAKGGESAGRRLEGNDLRHAQQNPATARPRLVQVWLRRVGRTPPTPAFLFWETPPRLICGGSEVSVKTRPLY